MKWWWWTEINQWWADDELLSWWWAAELMMSYWADDELMNTWCYNDNELMMNWWWTDDERMMNWWWADDEQVMNRWRVDVLNCWAELQIYLTTIRYTKCVNNLDHLGTFKATCLMVGWIGWMDLSQTTTTPRAPLYRAVLIIYVRRCFPQ